MKNLAEAADDAAAIFRETESQRENTIRCSRSIIRETKKMIHSIHLSEDHSVNKDRLCSLVAELTGYMDKGLFEKGPAEDALAEYAEAMIFESIVKSEDVPSFRDLGIGPGPWILGLADCLGEMRRVVLTSLVSEDVQRAVSIFSDMEEMFHTIMMFDIPDQILPIRRTQDIARGVMERTRTDITNALVMLKVKKFLKGAQRLDFGLP
jgi:translin